MARRQWHRRNAESISLLDGLMIITAVITIVMIFFCALAYHYGVTFDLTGALFFLPVDGAIGLLFFLSSRAVTVYMRYLARGISGSLISLAITAVYLTAVHLACSYLLVRYPHFVPDFRLIAVIDVVITGGFMSGLAHPVNSSAAEPGNSSRPDGIVTGLESESRH